MMNTFSVKNFKKFQHYKDRAPPWIKLYNELLDDYEFGLLPDASKMHLIAIWLLASRSANKIPFDPTWVARRINANDPVNLQLLADRKFIVIDQELHSVEQVDSTPLAECLSREETETETETEKSREDSPVAKATRPASDAFERFKAAFPRRDGANPWQPAEKKFNALVKTGVDPEVMIAAAAALTRDEASRGNVGTKFIPQAITWLNQQRFVDYAVSAATAHDEAIDWNVVCANHLRFGTWAVRHYGPEPGDPGCRCPPDVLLKHGITSDARTAKEVQRLISGAM